MQRPPKRRVILKLYHLRHTTHRITRGLQADVVEFQDDSALGGSLDVKEYNHVDFVIRDTSTVLRPHLAAKQIIVTSKNVEDAPLELDFESVMRRSPAPNTEERNITLTAKDLAACCRHAL
ncbi:hypothetical protein AOCH_000531 [Aspergillus ochraceoroseus]|nr:hypothetical protein AOCH_000531 [Aspergillus ochraceoroseus]